MVTSNFSELVRGDRVRANTPPEINLAIDMDIAATSDFMQAKPTMKLGKGLRSLIWSGISSGILKPMQP